MRIYAHPGKINELYMIAPEEMQMYIDQIFGNIVVNYTEWFGTTINPKKQIIKMTPKTENREPIKTISFDEVIQFKTSRPEYYNFPNLEELFCCFRTRKCDRPFAKFDYTDVCKRYPKLKTLIVTKYKTD